jgi:hypothetical protein
LAAAAVVMARFLDNLLAITNFLEPGRATMRSSLAGVWSCDDDLHDKSQTMHA